MRTIGVILGAEDGAEIEVSAVEEGDETLTTEMTETEVETGENINKGTMTIGVKDTIVHPEVVENSGIIIMITEIEARMDKEMVEERNGTEEEVKVMGIEVGVVDGTHMNNTLPKVITQVHTIKIQTTTVHHLWDIKVHIQHLSHNIHSTHNNSTHPRTHLHVHHKHPMFVNYVRMQDIMTTSASSLVTSYREHK